MKLSKDDIKYLNNFLSKELRYRETYNELQDHILSALEQYPENQPFETALQNIINTQFGGKAGLRAIDRQYKAHAVTEMRNRYLTHMVDLFKFPSLVYVLLVTIAVYFLLNYVSFSWIGYIGVFIIVSRLSAIMNGIRYIRTGYYYGTTKRSVSDDGFKILKLIPRVFAFLIVFCLWGLYFKSFNGTNIVQPGTSTLVFMSYLLHAVAFFKMYKQEFEITAAK
jgi:hypothetical protein